MNDIEKHCLAESYASAWLAVKGGKPITVAVEPHGWYGIQYGPSYRRVRALALFKGLATLTQRLAAGDVKGRAWQQNAPFNPQFLGAQPARAGEDY